MDRALLEERKKFKEQFVKAHTNAPSASKRSSDASASSSDKKFKADKEKAPSAKAKLDLAQLKQMGAGSQFKFGVLTKIVRHMKNRHLEGKYISILISSHFYACQLKLSNIGKGYL